MAGFLKKTISKKLGVPTKCGRHFTIVTIYLMIRSRKKAPREIKTELQTGKSTLKVSRYLPWKLVQNLVVDPPPVALPLKIIDEH